LMFLKKKGYVIQGAEKNLNQFWKDAILYSCFWTAFTKVAVNLVSFLVLLCTSIEQKKI
jgi:hypothetical protein